MPATIRITANIRFSFPPRLAGGSTVVADAAVPVSVLSGTAESVLPVVTVALAKPVEVVLALGVAEVAEATAFVVEGGVTEVATEEEVIVPPLGGAGGGVRAAVVPEGASDLGAAVEVAAEGLSGLADRVVVDATAGTGTGVSAVGVTGVAAWDAAAEVALVLV